MNITHRLFNKTHRSANFKSNIMAYNLLCTSSLLFIHFITHFGGECQRPPYKVQKTRNLIQNSLFILPISTFPLNGKCPYVFSFPFFLLRRICIFFVFRFIFVLLSTPKCLIERINCSCSIKFIKYKKLQLNFFFVSIYMMNVYFVRQIYLGTILF